MHIAICDDNTADRKQLERLLFRESDRRKATTGVLYVRSFGHSSILGKSPMSYDLFFIDMVEESPNGYEFALKLTRAGVTAPIVLCPSRIDYQLLARQEAALPVNLFFLNKPIKTAELTALLDHAICAQSKLAPNIELRSDQETFYLQEADIVCGYLSTHYVKVMLADGRNIMVNDSLTNLFSQLVNYSSYQMISKKAFINVDYIDKCSYRKVILCNGTSLAVSAEYRRPLFQYCR